MRKLLFLLAFVLFVSGTQAAVYFTIAPGPGFSEPLSEGDMVMIDTVIQPGMPGEAIINTLWEFSYGLHVLGEVYTTYDAFTMDGSGYVSGVDVLDVDVYETANSLRLHIWSRFVQQQYHSYSTNSLEVLPTMAVTPSTTAWGLIVLLLLVPAVLIWRR